MKKVLLIFLITMFLVGIVGADSENKLISNEMAVKLAVSTNVITEGYALTHLKMRRSMMWSMIEQNKLLAEQNKILKKLVIILKEYNEDRK